MTLIGNESACSSLIIYLKEAEPIKFFSGMNSIEPSGFRVAAPPTSDITLDILRVVLSISVSFPSN